jgi:hypothetical protein
MPGHKEIPGLFIYCFYFSCFHAILKKAETFECRRCLTQNRYFSERNWFNAQEE